MNNFWTGEYHREYLREDYEEMWYEEIEVGDKVNISSEFFMYEHKNIEEIIFEIKEKSGDGVWVGNKKCGPGNMYVPYKYILRIVEK